MANITDTQVARITNELMDLQKILAALAPSYSRLKEDMDTLTSEMKEAREHLIRLEGIPGELNTVTLILQGINGLDPLPTRVKGLENSITSLNEEIEKLKSTVKPCERPDPNVSTNNNNRTKIIVAIIGGLIALGTIIISGYFAAGK